MWSIYGTDEYLEWFFTLGDESKEDIKVAVNLLAELGPNLGRPYADTLHGAKIRNLKELRIQSKGHVFRVAFYFDPKRKGLLLVGGDKKGKNEEEFYTDLIRKAETLIRKYKDYSWE
ncbi:MAG: type II toxin-antitoxin system RelE/ParE family toxin [Spirochaetaceae bacterium]|jgi:hypothetical protein|nr:type II toxin-antitoxin system RelE/ParE family toxin [Spirochaetaceae bacterium]